MSGSIAVFALLALLATAAGSPRGRLTRDAGVPGGDLGAVECRKATLEVWHLPYPGDCTKFIKCDIIGNLSTIYTCDAPLHFNTAIQTCDWPENAGCEGGGTTKSTTSNPVTPSTDPNPTTKDDYDAVCAAATPEVWHLPYDGDCTKFIKCDYIGKKYTIYTCDTPLHFNPSIQTCDWPENAGCEGSGTTKSTTSNPVTPSTDPNPTTKDDYATVCAAATPEVWHLPYDGDCTKFIKCDYIGNKYTVYTCDSPLHFNPSIQTCDWPENAGCIDGTTSTTPQTTTISTTPKPTTSPTPSSTPFPSSTTLKTTTTSTTPKPTTNPPPPSTTEGCETTTPKECKPKSCEDDSSSSSSSSEDSTECTEKPNPPPTCPTPSTSPTTPPSSSPTPSTNPPPTGNNCPAPFGPDDVCRPASDFYWHIADPTDNTRFYKCEIASCRAFLFNCTAGTVFNQSIQNCAWPWQ